MKEDVERRIDLKQELEEFKKILYDHVDLLNTHIEHFKIHEIKEEKNYTEILRVQQDTNNKIAGLVEAWDIATNSIKALGIFGSVLKWITGIIIGIGSVWAIYSGNLPLGK